jgi:recombination protein RecT
MAENAVQVKKDVGQQVIDRIDKLASAGMVFAKDFNYVNAIKASMLSLAEVVDKNKRPALEVCTPASIQTALFNMATKSLDVSKNQAYFVVRGQKLCLHVSYFGHILQVKRLFPDWTPVAHTIREGDVFEYSIEPETGKMKLVKHEQKLENLDNDFIGAYMYIPCADGTQELYVMTKKQILKAWSKSSSQSLQTHKDFDEKMALKTIINSGCTKVINATPDSVNIPDDEEVNQEHETSESTDEDFTDFEEMAEEHKAQEQIVTKSENKTEQPQADDDEF